MISFSPVSWSYSLIVCLFICFCNSNSDRSLQLGVVWWERNMKQMEKLGSYVHMRQDSVSQEPRWKTGKERRLEFIRTLKRQHGCV